MIFYILQIFNRNFTEDFFQCKHNIYTTLANIRLHLKETRKSVRYVEMCLCDVPHGVCQQTVCDKIPRLIECKLCVRVREFSSSMQLESTLRCKLYTKTNCLLVTNQMLACIGIPFATRSLHIIWCNSSVSFGHQTHLVSDSRTKFRRTKLIVPFVHMVPMIQISTTNNEANICHPSTSRQVIIPKFHFFVPSAFDRKPMCEITSPIRNDRSVAHFRFYYFGA